MYLKQVEERGMLVWYFFCFFTVIHIFLHSLYLPFLFYSSSSIPFLNSLGADTNNPQGLILNKNLHKSCFALSLGLSLYHVGYMIGLE